MNKKIKSLITIVIIAIIIGLGVLVALLTSQNTKIVNVNETSKTSTSDVQSKIDKLSSAEKKILGIDEEETKDNEAKKKAEEESYSDLYKEYLELPEEEKEKSDIIPRQEDIPFEKIDEIKEDLDDEDDKDDNTIPARYNLAEVIDIKVEDQGFYSLCWDFASLKALETHLALKGLGNYDFSEMHVDYITSNLLYGYRYLHDGGNFNYFKKYLMESGVVLEEEVPYNYFNAGDNDYERFIDIKKAVEVTKVVEFPSFYKSQYSNYSDEEIAEFRETVKRHIKTNGGLYASTVSSGEKNHYTAPDTNEWANHAITVVGWDDNYSKDNFLSSDGKKPNKDGAYICLNSWGESYNDKGYFYISYEDRFIESELSGIASTSMEDAYKVENLKNQGIKDYLKKHFKHLFINYNGEEYVTPILLSSIGNLDLSNCNIKDLEEIQLFTHLNWLDLSNNEIKDISPLAELTQLITVDLSNNEIKDISPLAELTQLITVDLSNNNISDISNFKNIKSKNLNTLNLSNNQVKDVSTLYSEGNLMFLNLSNNPNIKGLEGVMYMYELDISGCNIKDISFFEDWYSLRKLNVANTPEITGLESLANKDFLEYLDCSNCGIEKIPELNVERIHDLKLANNNLTSLEGIQNYKYLSSIDVSNNPITDWSALKEIPSEKIRRNGFSWEELIDRYITIIANDCNIEDITVFNDIPITASLELQNNKIKDVSNFDNDKIEEIDLSNNENITGLKAFSKVKVLYLNNCNISDITEISEMKKLNTLSLENNNITDIGDISKLADLWSISLAGNKGFKGVIQNDNVYNVNLSNCELDNSIDLTKMKKLSNLNISGNPKIDGAELLKTIKYQYLSLFIDEFDYNELEKIKAENTNKDIYLQNSKLTIEYNLNENDNLIDLKEKSYLKRNLMNYITEGNILVENGNLTKKGFRIMVDDITKDMVEVYFIGSYTGMSNITLQININH